MIESWRHRRASSRNSVPLVRIALAEVRRRSASTPVTGPELDALGAELGLRRIAVYKVIFDARRKIRRALVANGYLEERAEQR